MSKWLDAHDCYWWIYSHPKLIFDGFANPWIDITPHKVCPQTRSIQENSEANTHIEFWVECGSHTWWDYASNKELVSTHDWELDCGGDTWEEAVLNLGNLVLNKYGDYEE